MQVRFVESISPGHPPDPNGPITIVCPWLNGLDAESGVWISALPIHDLNAFLEGDRPGRVESGDDERTYHGVFALDRFRSHPHLFSLLRTRGIRRIINVPSVS